MTAEREEQDRRGRDLGRHPEQSGGAGRVGTRAAGSEQQRGGGGGGGGPTGTTGQVGRDATLGPSTARASEPPVSGGPEGANTGTGALGQQREEGRQPPVSGGPEGANTGSGDLTARRRQGEGR